MRVVKLLISPTGKRKVRLFEREDGRFYFEEEYEEFDEDVGLYWTPGWQSGMYDTLESAETEMRSMTPWFKGAAQG